MNFENLQQTINQLMPVINSMGEPIKNTVLTACRIDAAQNIICAVLVGLGIIALWGVVRWVIRSSKLEGDMLAVFVILAGALTIAAFISLSPIFSIYNWIGIVHPQIYLAHLLLTKYGLTG